MNLLVKTSMDLGSKTTSYVWLKVKGSKKRTFTSVIFYCQNFANFDYPEDRATKRPRWVYYIYTPFWRGYTFIISLSVGCRVAYPG